MTHIYFIRHCQPDTSVHDDFLRPLSKKGMVDRRLVNEYLTDKDIDAVFSSPYKRAVDTVGEFATQHKLTITLIDELRERKVGDTWIEDFMDYARLQWLDFDYALENGESLNQVKRRCVAAVDEILHTHRDENVAIGFHGTALCALIHHYQPNFGYEDFRAMCHRMPWAVHFIFDGVTCVSIDTFDFHDGTINAIFSVDG